ncbi:PAS/PAC sensor signal transduction histidine kinase [Chitinophaga pinensis DSM 2588]|uniref:histidine kinase n=2 Tax=Chitinophaga pinensis TaxID=79329 RepID=A0A979G3R9_CHIPD|nr:PAS/PAC sensor signal transduction histidine kinase [Chitinophaga pinensis DSM 2588]
MEAIPECVKLVSQEGIILYINKTGLSYIDAIRMDEAIGKVVFDLIAPEYRTLWLDMNRRVCAGDTLEWEYEVVGLKGTRRYLQTRAIPHIMADGSHAQLAITKDITETRVASQIVAENKKRLEVSEARFRTLADKIQNLAWMADADGNMYWYNDRWFEYTGTTMEDMKGWGWKKLHHPDHLQKVIDFIKVAWTKNKPFEITHMLRGKDGNYRWFLSQGTPILDTAGNIIEWMGTLTDVDEQQQSLVLLENKVAERTEQLNQANMALLRSNNELQQFAHVASHDLKEPVRKIGIFTNLLQEQLKRGNTDKAVAYSEKIEHAATRMAALIEGILQYASVDGQQQESMHADLNQIMQYVQTDLELAIQQKEAKIIFKDVMPVVKGMPVLLQQLFYNIINNALKFSRPDIPPQIEISAGILHEQEVIVNGLNPKLQYVAICIRDNGIGFDQSNAQNIFRTYYRLNSKDQYEGTGLGLSLCRKIVERHGGTIEAEGIAGEGALFKIVLPVK